MKSKETRNATMFVALAGLVFGLAAASGCGADPTGDAPAPVPQEAMIKSSEASGNYYKQQHQKQQKQKEKSKPKQTEKQTEKQPEPQPEKKE